MKTRLMQQMVSAVAGALGIVALALPASAYALFCSSVQVIQLNDNENPMRCGGHGAFLTSHSSLFICAQTDLQMRMITAAYLSGRTISYQLDLPNPGDGCAANGSNYAAKTTDLYSN